MPGSNGLSSIQHFVVLMLENRSFDHTLSFLYTGGGNVSPAGQPYDGLTGNESNPVSSGPPFTVFKIEPTTPNAYFMPGADPGEGYMATNDQLFGSESAPANSSLVPSNAGFIKDFTYTLGWQSREAGWSILPGTTGPDIMGCFAPETLPVLSGLARGYAVCDQWFSSVPTETLPNRAFTCAGTSQGHMDDKTHTFTSPSIFGLLDSHAQSWAIYGYDAPPLTKDTFTDISGATASISGCSPTSPRRRPPGRWPRSRSSSPAGARPATASTRTTTCPWANSSSTTCTRRSGAVPDGPRRCWSSRTTSTAAATTTWRPRPERSRRTTTQASSVSTSPGSGCGFRRCWSRR